MNTVTVVGNLTRDPELRYTPTGQAVVKFGIAVNRFYTNRKGDKVESTDFFTVNAWRSLAENVAESLKTGARVVVTGRIQTRTWETEDADRRTVVEIEAEEVAASLRWATARLAKAKPGTADWVPDDEAAEEAPAE
jgi:single-strand DNA-binding protein